VHGGHDRERRLPDQPRHVLDPLQPPPVFRLADRILLLPQVVPGAERPARAGEDAGTHVVCSGLAERPTQLLHQFRHDRVQPARAVQGDDGDAVVAVVPHRRLVAGWLLLRG
jgi:hypothetical protein